MRYLFLSLFTALTFGLVACQHTDPQTTDKDLADLPAHHTEDGFRNLYIEDIVKGPIGYVKMRYFGDKPFADQEAEAYKVPIAEPDINELHDKTGKPKITWLGHSTFLIQYQGINILTDPMLTSRASPVPFAGPKRLVEMPIKQEDLPPIDYIVISHNHYDHLDAKTVDKFGDEPVYLVPLKLKEWFTDRGIQSDRVIEMDWWDEYKQAPQNLAITATPSQHWSARGINDRSKTLWAAWHIQIGDFSTWFGGDTGYNEFQFKEIGEKWQDIDLGLIPIGAYAPRWFMKGSHVNPDEAILIHQDIGAKQSFGMHWGTFQLTAEPIMEPAERIKQAEKEGRLKPDEFITLAVGEIRHFDARPLMIGRAEPEIK